MGPIHHKCNFYFLTATIDTRKMRKRAKILANMKNPQEVWLVGIREYVMSIFKCGEHSIHGPSHWQSVNANGLNIAEGIGADLTVVRLFALLHDSCRQDNGADIDHGPRAADMLDRIVPTVFAIDPSRFELLKEAIRLHTYGLTTNDPTIGTCWDADRLDIGRVGMTPSLQYMSTKAEKDMVIRVGEQVAVT